MLETYQIVPTKKKWYKPVGHVYTLLVVVLGFVLFRADTLAQGFAVIGAMFWPTAGTAAVSAEILSLQSPLFFLSFGFALLLSTPRPPTSSTAKTAGASTAPRARTT